MDDYIFIWNIDGGSTMVTSPTLSPQVNLSLMLFCLAFGWWNYVFLCELFVFCSLRNVNYCPFPIIVQPTCQNITKMGGLDVYINQVNDYLSELSLRFLKVSHINQVYLCFFKVINTICPPTLKGALRPVQTKWKRANQIKAAGTLIPSKIHWRD